MKKLLSYYQYIAPAVLTPLAWSLWTRVMPHVQLTLCAWLVPILWAYIVPGIGSNVLKVWEFNTRLKLGRFRPHHGFVFGSATAMLAWLAHASAAQSWSDVAQSSFVMAAVIGFWNVLYEIAAIRAGLLQVYNQPWADGEPAETIAMDYSPWFFGGFGAAYGGFLAMSEWFMPYPLPWWQCVLWVLGGLSICIAVPVFGFMQHSLRKHGHAGTRPIMKKLP